MTALSRPVSPAADLESALGYRLSGRRGGERQVLVAAAMVALGLHGAMMLLDLPRRESPPPPARTIACPTITRFRPEPPAIREKSPTQPSHRERILPVPMDDPTDSRRIVAEPLPTVNASAADRSVAIDLPLPVEGVAPPASGPRVIDPSIEPPRLILSSKVAPDYPELPRTVRIQADVTLRALILRDGSVGEVEILRCTQPDLGFEEAAIEAVSQWRYEPALQAGRPVDVYFTVFVSFRLR